MDAIRPSFGFTPIYHTEPAQKRYQRGGTPRLDTPMIATEWFWNDRDCLLVILYCPERTRWIEAWNHKRNQWEQLDIPGWAWPLVDQLLDSLLFPDRLLEVGEDIHVSPTTPRAPEPAERTSQAS